MHCKIDPEPLNGQSFSVRLPDDRFSPDMYQGGSVNEHQLLTTKNFIIQQIKVIARNYQSCR